MIGTQNMTAKGTCNMTDNILVHIQTLCYTILPFKTKYTTLKSSLSPIKTKNVQRMLKYQDGNWQTNEGKSIQECFQLCNIFVKKVKSNEGFIAFVLQPPKASQHYTTI